jgi:outer membrane protein OmpA-like peptidoglycan-associated protein
MVARLIRIGLVTLAVACAGSSQGKPKTVVTSDTSIEIFDPIAFVGAAELAPASYKILNAVAATLDGNPEIKLIEVTVHVTDGDEPTRQERADQRAQAIIDYLIRQGVAATRLRPKGVATTLAPPHNFVELIVVERS